VSTGALLELDSLSVGYGAVRAVSALDVTVREGEFVVLLGPNGAGKTTTLRAVSGLLRASGGRIRFAGRDVTRLPAHRRTALGIAQVPEGRQIFPDHTVAENLQLGAFVHRRQRSAVQSTLDDVLQLFPRLAERRAQPAGTLSGGEAQMLAVARALMVRPRLLMLDEPSLGLAPLLVAEMFSYVGRLHRQTGLTVLLVEQQARIALRLADRAYLLERGRAVLDGAADQLTDDDRVRHSYLGG
jgi:branched-chain amino acid transport system ATP-binding protein